MEITKSELIYLIENEICNSVDEGVEITACLVEEKCWVVHDRERESCTDLYYSFDIDDDFFEEVAKLFD